MSDLYKHWTKRIVYTSGVRELAERCGAFWFVDIVASYQVYPHVAQEPFQVWHLSRTTGRRFVATMGDGNSKTALIRQEIEYSDYPEDTLELWYTDGVLMLPGEY